MSTRACYVFKDGYGAHIVYKHHDGYPSGAVGFIAAARKAAWSLPRFEANEFAAAFVAANKTDPGGVRLVGNGDWRVLSPGDIEYVYIITEDRVDACYASGESIFSWPLADIENANIHKLED